MRAEIISDHKVEHLRAGFKAAGYKMIHDNNIIQPDDVLVTWNRKPSNESAIRRYERAGAKVIIAENGYIGQDDDGHRLISLAHNYHLGAGRQPMGEEPRYLQHNFKIEPWRAPGKDIVLLAQRGIGNAMRIEWYNAQALKIQATTGRKVRVRPHPGRRQASPLEPAIENAHAVVTYSSGAALYALAFGVPVFYLMSGWIGADASVFGIGNLESPRRGDRTSTFHRIGWAQWTVEEIRSGQAIKAVMNI
jgi:hypothetical protein